MNNDQSTGRAPAVVKQTKAQEISLVSQTQLKIQSDRRLKGAFTLNVADGQATTTYVFHHPIGITKLDAGDWVCTPIANIPSLLARATDPRQSEINQVRAAYRNGLLIQKRCLIEMTTPSKVPGEKDIVTVHYLDAVADRRPRNEILSEADEKFASYKKAVRDGYKSSHPQATQRELDTVKIDRTRDDFLAEDVATYEKKLREITSSPDFIKEVEAQCPQPFETLGGPLENVPQRACSLITRGVDTARARDEVLKAVHRTFSVGTEGRIVGSAAAAPNPPIKSTGSKSSSSSSKSKE